MATRADIRVVHVHKPNREGNQISCIYESIGQGYGLVSYVHKQRFGLGLVCLYTKVSLWVFMCANLTFQLRFLNKLWCTTL